MNNKVMLLGRVVKVYDNGINIAIARDYKNEEGIYETDFIRVRTSGNITEKAKAYLAKGDLIGISGRLETENNRIVVIAEKLTFLAPRRNVESEEE